MSLFKVNRGNEAKLPTKLTDGWAYFCIDTGLFLIDHYDSTNTLVRSKISAEYADKLRYVQDGETIELTPEAINTYIGKVEADLSNYKTEVSEQFTEVDITINNHITTNNPHGVTKDQVGLANVDNTSDLEKPISYAVDAALAEKANVEHNHNDLYYTKDETSELITVEDIDDICDSTIIAGGGSDFVSYATKQWVEEKLAGHSSANSVLYTEQALTDEQKAQVRANVGIDAYIQEAFLGGEW